jgi:hypothetical protein
MQKAKWEFDICNSDFAILHSLKISVSLSLCGIL